MIGQIKDEEQRLNKNSFFLFPCGFKCHLPDNTALVIFWLSGHSWAAPVSKSCSTAAEEEQNATVTGLHSRETTNVSLSFVVAEVGEYAAFLSDL